MQQSDDWFGIDKEGLALQIDSKARTVLEVAAQNPWDEDGTTRVEITLTDHPKRGRSTLVVEDDAPDGFADLTHAYTLFAKSKKGVDPTKRGRFNLGEKLLLSVCDEAMVVSTRGGVEFPYRAARKSLRRRREAGTRFEAVVQLTGQERQEVASWVRMLLPPEGITTVFNGTTLTTRTPVRTFETTLPTVIADAEGVLRTTRRKTTVRLFEPQDGEAAYLYELGIPVVEHEGRWHVDIAQKVPLNHDRDNVTPGYLREVRVAVLNESHDLLTRDDATTTWVKEAASDDRAETAAVQQVMVQRYGDKAVVYDPSDPEANKEAVLKGYTVVHGGMMSKGEWSQVKRSGSLLPAGQVTPSNSTIESSPDGVPPLDVKDWTPGMHRVAEYAQALAKDLLGVHITVDIYPKIRKASASYSPGHLSLYLQVLGHRWFDQPHQHMVDELLLHEFAHHQVSDHLSERFHDECCRLGALLRDSSERL